MRHGYLSKWNELSITTAKENRTTQTTSVTIYKNCISCMNIYNANKNRDRNKMRISKLQGNKVKDNESINKNLLQFSNRGSTWVCRNPPGGRHLNFRMSIKKMQKYLTGLFPTYIYPINKAFLTVRLCFENIYVKNPVFSQTPYQLVRLFHPVVNLIVHWPPVTVNVNTVSLLTPRAGGGPILVPCSVWRKLTRWKQVQSIQVWDKDAVVVY